MNMDADTFKKDIGEIALNIFNKSGFFIIVPSKAYGKPALVKKSLARCSTTSGHCSTGLFA